MPSHDPPLPESDSPATGSPPGADPHAPSHPFAAGVPTTALDAVWSVVHWLFTKPLPPYVSVPVIVAALSLAALPLLSPTVYAVVLKGTAPERLAELAGALAEEKFEKIQKALDEATTQNQALNEELTALRIKAGADAAKKPLKVKALFETPVDEAWVGAIHRALDQAKKQGQIEYDHEDELDASEIDDRARAAAEAGYDLVIGDAFGAERELRHVAREFTRRGNEGTAFVFGSALGPSPNFSVFDNWIHEPAYVAGMIAAAVSQGGRIGVVAGKPIEEITRIVNAFITGAHDPRMRTEGTPPAQVIVRFTDRFHDTARAADLARELIEAQGVDFIYSERDGAVHVCREHGLPCIGNLTEQWEHAPNSVVSTVVWNMGPTIQRVIAQLRAGTYVEEDYGSLSRMYQRGSELSRFPLNNTWRDRVGRQRSQQIESRYDQIRRGVFRVPVIEIDPRHYAELAANGSAHRAVKLANHGGILGGASR